ncbi:hypothetical protein [Plantibacter sp. YIM 135249]|jgi:hypothetical protein|uniref:hypothetical protein n=1 Tax=Plantibacter sp. YIM 135249 TaxID=3423918 RepID=UPI003D353E3E
MADPKAPGEGYDVLIHRLSEVSRRLDLLEVASGSQRARQADFIDGLRVTKYAENTSVFGFSGTGWTNAARPSVTLSSVSGRLKVSVGGAASGGTADITFSIDGVVTRDSRRQDSMLALATCIRVSGGASMYGSGAKSWVVAVPANTPLTVTVEAFGFDQYVNVAGLSILAEVIP